MMDSIQSLRTKPNKVQDVTHDHDTRAKAAATPDNSEI